MRLTLAIHPVTEMRLGSATRLEGSRLQIDQEDLRRRLLEDTRLHSVDLEIVRPGENCRVGIVFDIIEPRAKEPGSGPNFPGILDPYGPVGNGTTHVLRGAVVTVVDEASMPTNAGPGPLPDGPAPKVGRYFSKILEMTGAPAEHSVYSKLQHLVVIPHAQPELERHTALNALRLASVKAAVYLASASIGHRPSSTEVFDLEGPSVKGRDGLPRLAYIGGVHGHQFGTDVDEKVIYGSNTVGMLPVPLHPNEWMDGALVISYSWGAGGLETYYHQNHPIIQEFYRYHNAGTVTFVGTVATCAADLEEERLRNTMLAAHIAKWNLNADGAVVTKYAGGAPHADMFETARQCEQMGIETVVLALDLGWDGKAESAVLMHIPEVKDLVVLGWPANIRWQVPAAERVISGNPAAAQALASIRELTAGAVAGLGNQQGGSRIRAELY